MYFLGVLCLLSVAVALPTPEQLHTNLPAIPPPPELKPEKDESSEKVIVYPPGPIPDISTELPDESDESHILNVLESAEKSKEDNDKAQDKPDDKEVIQKDSKESKESKDSKEKSKESKESKELNDKKEIKPEEPQEEKKEKDSKSEESKERFDEDVPVIVEVTKGPKGYLPDWFSDIWDHISFHWPFRRPEIPNDDQPIYIVKESDLDFD